MFECWSPKAPKQFEKSHWCVPFTASFGKRRMIGALWSERCDDYDAVDPVSLLIGVVCQLANSAPPLSVTDSAIAPSTSMRAKKKMRTVYSCVCSRAFFVPCSGTVESHHTELRNTLIPRRMCCARLCAMPAQHLEDSEQAQRDILPSKNWCEKQVSTWRHISWRTDNDRYYTWS